MLVWPIFTISLSLNNNYLLTAIYGELMSERLTYSGGRNEFLLSIILDLCAWFTSLLKGDLPLRAYLYVFIHPSAFIFTQPNLFFTFA